MADGIDSAWPTRIPPGWRTFPNGAIGPPNQIGSDWNAPYRTVNGVNPPSPSQLRGVGSTPNMGYPAIGIGPQGGGGGAGGGGGIVPTSDAGGGPPGTSLNTTGPQSPPAPADPTGTSVTQNQTIDPAEFQGADSGGSGLSGAAGALGTGGIWGLGSYLMGKTVEPRPAGGPDAPTDKWFQKPSGVGGMPGPQVTNPPAPSQRGMPFPQNNDVSPQMGMPWAGNNAGQPDPSQQMGMPWAGNNAGRPYGVGPPAAAAAPPAAGGGGRGRINPASVNLGRGVPGVHPAVAQAAAAAQQPGSPFTMVPRPNANPGTGGGMLGGVGGMANIGSGYGGARGGGGAPLGTALDLSHMFGGQPPPAAAPAVDPRAVALAPAPRAPVRGPLAKGALPAAPRSPGTGGIEDPSIIAHQRMRVPTTPAGYGDQSWLYGNQPPM